MKMNTPWTMEYIEDSDSFLIVDSVNNCVAIVSDENNAKLIEKLPEIMAERDAALERIKGLEKAAKHAIKKLRSHHLCRSGIGAIVAKLEEDINGR
jgi:Zn-finger protein